MLIGVATVPPETWDDDFEFSISFLPNELLTAIFMHCRPHDLAILSRVSLRFNALAERLLYASIYIKDMLSPASPSPWRTTRCCKSLLLMNERRESLVRAGRGRGMGTEVFCVRWLNGATGDARSPPPPMQNMTNDMQIETTDAPTRRPSTPWPRGYQSRGGRGGRGNAHRREREPNAVAGPSGSRQRTPQTPTPGVSQTDSSSRDWSSRLLAARK